MRERGRIASIVDGVRALERETADAVELIEMAEAEGDAAMVKDALASLIVLAAQAKQREIESLLSGEADSRDAFMEINAGSGGTEAQDWAQMLQRMYTRWAEARGFKVEILDMSEGEQAGIKSVTMQITGANAYGWLKTESGVHRLVRISPYDSAARRHTSFSSVWVYPVVDDTIEIEINPADLKVDTFRASGAGGQHVNKTESAIRLTHAPSGTVVSMQDHRSQQRNREDAWKVLRSRVAAQRVERRQEEAARLRSSVLSRAQITRGDKIRTYNYGQDRCSDHRAGLDTHNLPDVLAGGETLDRIMGAAREWLVAREVEAVAAEEEAKQQQQQQ